MARLTVKDLEIDRKEPLEVEMSDGVVFTFADPRSLRFDDIVSIDLKSPSKALGLVLGEEGFEAFTKHPEVDGYFIDAILQKYIAHFGLQTPGEVDA